jgi:hypothetical protein
MVTPLPHPGTDSSLNMERESPTIITTPGGMSLNLSRPLAPSHADRWESHFLLLLQFRDRVGHLRAPRRHVEDGHHLGDWISKQRAHQKTGKIAPEKERRLKEIGFVWNVYEEKWDTMFRALIQFKQREGHCNVSHKHIEHMDGGVKLNLGIWVQYQRFPQRDGDVAAIKAERLERLGVTLIGRRHRWFRKQVLESLGAHSDPQISSPSWDCKFLLLLQFRDREGHLRVPHQHVEDGQQLGNWVSSQRMEKKNGTLIPERERRLNEIGCIWEAGHWDTMFRALTQFKQREGHCNVSDDHIEYLDGEIEDRLGHWLLNQCLYQEKGVLKAERVNRLESMGVVWNCKRWDEGWDTSTEEHFDQNFDLLLAFQEREGHVRVPCKHREGAADNLGLWLAAQLSLHRRGLLELDRQKWLEVAGVEWEKVDVLNSNVVFSQQQRAVGRKRRIVLHF